MGETRFWGPNHHTPSVKGICGKDIKIFTKCTIRNQHDIRAKVSSENDILQSSMSSDATTNFGEDKVIT